MIDEVIAVSEKGVDAFEDWINEKQYYGELSLMDELAGWENLQKKYRAGSEERMKIDREVYRVQNDWFPPPTRPPWTGSRRRSITSV